MAVATAVHTSLDISVPGGRLIPGVLTHTITPSGVIVMLHGLFTDMHHNFAQELAEALTLATGLAVYRFNFLQHTDPAWVFPGFPEDILDVDRVTAALSDRGLRVVCMIGHSKGANVALLHAAQAARRGACVPTVALAPRFFMSGMQTFLFSATDLATLRDGETGTSLKWTTKSGDTILVTQDMLDAVSAIDMGAVVQAIPLSIPILLVHGRKDQTIPVSDADAFAAARPLEKHVLKTGHVFSDERAKMIRLVVGWVARHCVKEADLSDIAVTSSEGKPPEGEC